MKPEATSARWRKSSFSNGQNGACVEVSSTVTDVRDSKNVAGPVLSFGREQLISFVKSVKADRFES